MEHLIIFNFFSDILFGDLGGYLDRRRTAEGMKQGAYLEI
jgi:hypothetical protein